MSNGPGGGGSIPVTIPVAKRRKPMSLVIRSILVEGFGCWEGPAAARPPVFDVGSTGDRWDAGP